ncbi:electron transport complex subunit RsxC [Pseudoalteromonas sp. T1lg65]|uniref:electron transport complex subunit RsxC n=1 Tax=Pseudoalteromonas sp. T1lg65 TaxID=2077101 RepID=UPI003F7B2B17
METLLEQIKSGKLWQFPGGIHPPEQKTQSNQQAIARLALPEKLVLPLKQHIGANGQLLVSKGDHVLKGQALSAPSTNWSLPVHAPTSGYIEDIQPMPSAHPSALPELSIVLRPDGEERWVERTPRTSLTELSHKQIIDIIHEAGIAGMGGAGFPTYVKADSARDIEFLVINGVECEPYITADDRLMREHAKEIVSGAEVLQHLLNPKAILFGIEDNKPEAISAIKEAAKNNSDIIVQAIPTKYPSGGEKQLIKVLTNKEVPSTGLPADIGVLVQNVGTLFAIHDAVYNDQPLIERVVTVTGNTITNQGNVWALLGTEIKHLLDQQGFTPVPAQRVVMGGPMMGFTLPTVRIPVVKTTNCILAPDNQELAVPGDEQACIRCSACADACPQSLLPQQLQWFAKGKEYQKLEEYNLFDCIECGACSYVCPSEIPLVQYYRVAKAEIREQKLEQVKAERAKARFEARKERLEREQEERQNRHKQRGAKPTQSQKTKVEEALARVTASKPDNSAVQAAIARAKAKRNEQGELEPDNSAIAEERARRKEQARQYKAEKSDGENSNDDKKAAVAAAIARAKAKKADASEAIPTEPGANEVDPKKAAVAAAIARAKAKKAAQNTDSSAAELSQPEASEVDPKKAAVAAAIARAKAKKAAKEAEASKSTPAEPEANEENQVDPKKAAVAAAIARAKAKKAAKEAEASESPPVEPEADEASEVDPKKAAVAAAIARAKAKKAAKEAEASEATPAEPEANEVDPKKAAIAAAIARAKAKKAAKEVEASEATPAEPETKQTTAEAEEVETPQVPLSAEDKKRQAVKAAIAKAKAKKQANKQEGNEPS